MKIKPYNQNQQIEISNNSGNLVKDPQKISNLMNSYFASVGENLSKNITPPLCSNNYLTGINTVNQTMFLTAITVLEMENYINNLNATKSTKSTSPPIKFIKLSVKIISPILTQIFNCCINQGHCHLP